MKEDLLRRMKDTNVIEDECRPVKENRGWLNKTRTTCQTKWRKTGEINYRRARKMRPIEDEGPRWGNETF